LFYDEKINPSPGRGRDTGGLSLSSKGALGRFGTQRR
jgi:hypothetical protein